MYNFLDEVRGTQKKQLAKQKTPQQVYKELHQFELEASLAFIKNMLINDAKNNPTNKNLKGRIRLGGNRYTARINQTPDVETEYYTIDRNYLPGDDYLDYGTGNSYSWMYTASLYEVKEDRGFFSNMCRIVLTKRGKLFLDELKRMCAAEKITVKFCACAKWWLPPNTRNTGEVFVDFDHEFKFKGNLVDVYLMVDYLVKL